MSTWQRLHPFRAELATAGPPPDLTALTLVGALERQGPGLRLRYRLEGALDQLRLPQAGAEPARRDGLWQHTCLEAFWGLPGSEAYWELNASPSGEWNLYRLDRYREGLRPEPLGGAPRSQWTLTSAPAGGRRLELELWCGLPETLQAGALEASLTAVLEHRDGMCTYWALTHPGPEPDFHRRDGFVLRL